MAKTYHDLAGRVTKTIEAYTSGTPTASSDRTVEYTYNGLGDIRTLKAVLPSSSVQTTAYIYNASPTAGSTFYSDDMLSEVRHPDKTTGAASSSEKETYGYNTLGEPVSATDRNGTTHTYLHDVLGRLTSDTAGTLGSGIDGAVRRLETTYDTLGQPLSFTGYDATTSGNVVNQVVRAYNGLGQITTEYQSHSGAVNTSTTPKVQYTYSEMSGGANHSRLTQMVYPQGATANYTYASGIDAAISRVSSAEMLSPANATLSSEAYSYLGLATVVKKITPVATLSYIQQSGDTDANTDAGDQYTGLDRFGRVIDQVWRDSSSGALLDRYQYGYDRNGNRLFKDNLVDSAMSELYGYDNLNQLTDFERGVLSDANSDGLLDTVTSPSRTQDWTLDAMGNWSTLTTNGTGQSRTHNSQNQVTGVGSSTLTYDADGSLTADGAGRIFIYDAWNRLVSVRNTANSPIVEYEVDALGRRIIEDRPNANTVDHLYYSSGWQVLEERRDGTADSNIRRQYFWSIDYVDALTARVDYASGAVSATYHAQYDANWNITAIADATSGVLERYIYDPYGTATVLYANWTVRGGSPYGWNYLHQGGRFDVDSNLYHFRHRDYSTTLGRWTQTDPIGFDAGDVNLYRYVGNGPVGLVDPNGLEGGLWDSGLWPWNWFDDTIDDAKTIINAGETVDDNFNRNVGYRWDPFDPNAPIVTHAGIIYPGGKPLTKDTAKLCQTVAEYGAAAGGMYGRLPLPRYNGPKPRYTVNPPHRPGRGYNPRKTPLPPDAEDVFRRAVPENPTDPWNWYGKNSRGQIYRFSCSDSGSAHFSGIDDVGDGIRNITPYARKRLKEIIQ